MPACGAKSVNGTLLERLGGFEDDAVRGVGERLLDAAVQSGADMWYANTLRHDADVPHQDVLMEHLRRIISVL